MSSPSNESRRRKVLFFTSLYPSSRGSGSNLRAFSTLRAVASRDDVYLVVVNLYPVLIGPEEPSLAQLCKEIKFLKVTKPGIEPVKPAPRADYFLNVDATEVSPTECSQTVLEFYQSRGLDTLFLFRLQSLYGVTSSFLRFPQREIDLDELPSRAEEANLRLGQGFASHLSPSGGVLKGLQAQEKIFIPKFHRVYVSSTFEIERVRQQTGFAQAQLLPNIAPDRPFLTEAPQENPREIIFVGKFDHPPNVDAVLWYLNEIHPLLRRAKGDGIVVRVIGYSCPPEIREWHGKDGIEVCGYVRDLDEVYARASLVVVPLRAGSGTRLKILEAFAYGRPVVSTTIGAEGLEVTPGKELLVADTPEAFAQACLEALDQPDLARKLVENGLQVNRKIYSKEALAKAYEKIQETA